MKPLRLELDHIGPFASHSVINFEELGDIFLIHGKTGSGKTSIFDAICYALYGKLPGSRRDQTSRLKSDFSPPEAIPRVVLEFSLGPRTWRIERSPSSLRPKKKGQGLMMSEDEAFLFERMADGSLEQIEGMKSKTDEAIARLIGLSAEEFSRIILLPQGEFAEFLRQNSKERREVLKKLFPIERAERVKEMAQERGRQLKGALAEAERRLRELEESVRGAGEERAEEILERERAALSESEEALLHYKESADSIEAYRHSIGERKGALEEARLRLEQAEEALNDAFTARDSIAKKREELARARASEAFIRLSERRNEARLAFDRALEEKADAKQALERARLDMEGSQRAKDRLEELRSKSAELTGTLKALEELAGEEAASAASLNERAQLKTESEEAHAQLIALSRREEALVDEEGQLAHLAGGLEELGKRKNDKHTRLEILKPLIEWAKEEARIQGDIRRTGEQGKMLRGERETLLTACEKAEVALETLKSRCASHENARLAARLALELSKGSPCPVCGATEHPLPAAAPRGSTEDDETGLKEADKTLRKLQNDLARVDAALDLAREEYKRSQIEQERLGPAPAGLDGDAVEAVGKGMDGSISLLPLLERERAAVVAELNDLTGPEKEANKAAARIREIRNLRDGIAAERQTLERSQTVRTPRLAVLETGLSALSARRDRLLTLPSCAGARTCAEARERLSGESAKVHAEIQAVEREREETIQNFAAAQKRMETVLEHGEQMQEAARKASEDFDTGLAQSPFPDEEALEAALSILARREVLEEDIRTHEKLFEAARALHDERAQSEEKAREALDRILRTPPPLLADETAASDSTGSTTDSTAAHEHCEELLSRSEKALFSLQEKMRLAQDERDRARDRIAAMERQGNEYAEARERFGRLSKEAAEYDKLYRDLAGTNTGRKAFDAWLMGMYLREVTACASKRLEKMSEGRYRLMVDSDTGRRNTLTGLDLAVWDACTGKMRPCATLSGGESFMAAISLALGLADSIQNRSGGIRLDALFIDEGFGSLDEQSLEQALGILDEIRDHRMVGLISHVAEMRTRIPSRVEVIKGSSGSTLRPAIDRE